MGREEIRSQLEEQLQLGITVQIYSLASDPYSSHKQVATLSLSQKPQDLSHIGQQDEWPLTLLDNENVEQHCVLDTHFKDFTPLHSGDDRDWKLEYAFLGSKSRLMYSPL